jgi:hypothetical protein
MKEFVFVLSAVFLLGMSTSAQEAPQNVPSSDFSFADASSRATNYFAANSYTLTPALSSSFDFAPVASSAEASASGEAGPPPQGVYGVRPSYPLQAYVGYTFLRFYEVPSTTVAMNGFNFGIVFYPKSWIGADSEFVLTLGNQYPYQARFLLGMGGVRVRATPFQRNIEVWAHALAGATHFVPQTAYGGQGAFAYELGVGADLDLAHPRYAIRVSGDAVGTTYFGTYQLSPKFSAGFVYKF